MSSSLRGLYEISLCRSVQLSLEPFLPRAQGFFSCARAEAALPTVRDRGRVLAAELEEPVSLPEALQRVQTEVGPIAGSGSRTVPPLK